jgi:YesN/AraC family two-component response regulator
MLSEHHDVETAVNGRDAFEKYKAGKFDLVVTDQGMPEMNGLQLAAAIKQAGSAVPVILLTGYGQALPTQGDSTTAVDLVISKPITKSGLRDAIAKVIK